MSNPTLTGLAQHVVDHFCNLEQLPRFAVGGVAQAGLLYSLDLDLPGRPQTLSVVWLTEDSLEQEIRNGLEKYRKRLRELVESPGHIQ